MTEKIKRRGVKTPDRYEPDILQTTTVQEIVTPLTPGAEELPYVFTTDDVGLAAEMMGKYELDTLLVLDKKNNRKPAGVITASTILKHYSDQKLKDHIYNSPARTRRILVQGRKLFKRMRRK